MTHIGRFGGQYTPPPKPGDKYVIAFWGCAVPLFFLIGGALMLWKFA